MRVENEIFLNYVSFLMAKLVADNIVEKLIIQQWNDNVATILIDLCIDLAENKTVEDARFELEEIVLQRGWNHKYSGILLWKKMIWFEIP